MIVKRLAAVVAAAGLVVAAFVVRSAIDEDQEDCCADPGAAATEPLPRAVSGELVCITELADACSALAEQVDALDVTVEPAGATLDRLAAADDVETAPLWLTVEPYPAMADAVRRGRTPIEYATTPVAASALGVAVPGGPRAGALAEACQGTELWRCLGDHAGDGWSDLGGETAWGTLRPSLGDVADSALGLASFSHAVAAYLGTADVDSSAWGADSRFIPWARRLARASNRTPNSGGTPLLTMATRPSALDVAATASYEVTALGAGADGVELLYSRPDMWLQVVLAVPGGASAPDELTDLASEQLTGAGWDATIASDAAPLPAAAAMLELRGLWEDAS